MVRNISNRCSVEPVIQAREAGGDYGVDDSDISDISVVRDTETIVRCPTCGSDAYYRYGKTANGKKRFLCLSCNRQYTLEKSVAREHENRPLCPTCNSHMHIYRKQKGVIRFRCGRYPKCRTFVKTPL